MGFNVHKDLFDNKSALVQVIAWCQTGTKPLPEPMLTKLPYDVTRPQWVKMSQDLMLLTSDYDGSQVHTDFIIQLPVQV